MAMICLARDIAMMKNADDVRLKGTAFIMCFSLLWCSHE